MQNKVISLLQPWASLVVTGHKKIETRSWNTKYRGELLIHASMGFNRKQRKICHQEPFNQILFDYAEKYGKDISYINWNLPFGAIIGKVDLIDTVNSELFFTKNEDRIAGYEISEIEKAFGDYSPHRFGWLLENPLMFKNPIPAKGQLNLWNWDGEI